MNATAPVAERRDTSIFSFGRELRPTEIALRQHRNELARASARVEAANATVENLRGAASCCGGHGGKRSILVDRQAAALVAENYGDVDPKDRKLKHATEKNAFDSQIAVDATKKALAAAENKLREESARLGEVQAQTTELVLQDLVVQHQEAIERLRTARAAYYMPAALADRGRELQYVPGSDSATYFRMAERMIAALTEEKRRDAAIGDKARASASWSSAITRLLAGAE